MPRRGSDLALRVLLRGRWARSSASVALSEGATMRSRTAVAAVLAVGVTVGPGLTACGSSQSSAGGKPTLTWYINPDGGGSDPAEGQAEIAEECTDAAGGRTRSRRSCCPATPAPSASSCCAGSRPRTPRSTS